MQATIVFKGETISPTAFDERCCRSAAALQAARVGDGDVVALMQRNSPEALEMMIATRRLGAQWCPVNWHFKTDEVQYILGNSGAKVFVVDPELLAGLVGLQTDAVSVFTTRAGVAGVPAWDTRRNATAPITSAPAAPRGAMFYTSGTTGRPKGIVRAPSTPEQLAAGARVRNLAYGFEPGLGANMRALVNAPMYHSAPNGYSLGVAMEGGTLYIEERFDAERTLQLIEQHRLTHAYLVPTMYVRMLALPAAVRAQYDLRSMRFVGSTGSPCPPEVKRAMIDWWGPVINE
ncbi:MAG: AMP-binding protein, partial [Aquabacterium sp.]